MVEEHAAPDISPDSDPSDDVRLSPQVFHQLAETIDGDDHVAVAAILAYIANRYRAARDQRIEEPSFAQARAAIEQIVKQAQELELMLGGLDGVAKAAFQFRPEGLGQFGREFLERRRVDLASLASVGMATLRQLRTASDRIPHAELDVAIQELVELFEAHGIAFTHTRDGNGNPASRTGRLIVAFFKLVDEKVLAHTLTTKLDEFRRARARSLPRRQADSTAGETSR